MDAPLPQAESSYSDHPVSDLSIDLDYEGLRYFEMMPEQSQRLMGGGRKWQKL